MEREEIADWKRMRFKKNKIWLAMDQNGKPINNNGKVLIKYQLNQNYKYWVYENGVKPLEASQNEQKIDSHDEEICHNAVCIYTDGASSGNPGPSGIGILLSFRKHKKEISKYIGIATNNIAELEAIKTALLSLKETNIPVRIFTDSEYAYGVLTLGWKAKKNQTLINTIKNMASNFSDLKFIKVRGHIGIEGNERADFLATLAIKKQKNIA
ncbi:MAG: hypothetical protein JW786_11085 [Desulfobacterales bacterium]|nr:hypothetical protein [Desulfobacterales bacterium]